ncbi:pyridoxal phosphate-dependent transferase [Xylariaceae sp. FL1272]|nr:pyridoxal phosphate-dependent transferase [Xylariaceae sp. FL1272]
MSSEEIRNVTWLGLSGSAKYDFRSDVVTTPTPSMLAAIASCSLQDDVSQEDETTNDLEAYCAALTGTQSALFVLSGTMGNQLALRALLTQPPHSVLCDSRSHVFNSEAGGVALLTSAMVRPATPRNGLYLTLEDVEDHFQPAGSIIGCPTKVISLENTLHGVIAPLKEVQRISAFAKRNNVKMHCDGARLWEAAAAGAGSLTDYVACFDTVTLCFSKGLGAPVGSILVGDSETIRVARHIRKAVGGGLRQPGLITAAARVALGETFGTNPDGQEGLLKRSHDTAKVVESMWKSLGGSTKYPVQTNIVYINLKDEGISLARFNEIGQHEGLRLKGERLVVHYQIAQNADDTLERLRRVFVKAWSERGHGISVGADANASVY